ncbi:MAG TPA: hypothetical protein VHO72_06825 [Bacteroidales bacterium]|nr:hypothetical protein [Bacteroidales bacterium]
MKHNLLTILMLVAVMSFSACKNKNKTQTNESGEIVIEQRCGLCMGQSIFKRNPCQRREMARSHQSGRKS